jgi:uncharacterized protein YvpB
MRYNPRKVKKTRRMRWLVLLAMLVTIGKLSWDLWSDGPDAHAMTPTAQVEQTEPTESTEQPASTEQTVQTDQSASTVQTVQTDQSASTVQTERTDQSASTEQTVQTDQSASTVQTELTDQSASPVQTDPTPATAASSNSEARPASVNLSVQIMKQLPELYNGCEVTSLSMLLNYAGHPVGKLELARNIRKDPTPEQVDASGKTIRWGNPNTGFVGDVTGDRRGYSVYHGPISDLLDQYLPDRAVDLTGESFETLLNTVANGKPVVVWVTEDFAPTEDWVSWDSPSGNVRATFSEHCVLLTGYDEQKITLNDPLDGQRKQVNRANFQGAWEQLGQQAVTYR